MLVLLVLLAASAAGVAVPEVREVTCTGDEEVTLEVEAAEVVVEGVVRFRTRVYRVDGEVTFPSATIRMQAGEECRMRVVNRLEGAGCTGHGNGYHCPDTTSLHTHGLHVSPSDDDIDTHVEPGEEHTYSYAVPDYHMMGTHWYHAHHHGSTALQALGGLAGMLLVEQKEPLPEDLARLYDNPSVPPLLLNYLAFGDTTDPGFFGFYTHKDLVELYDPVTVPLDLEWEGGEGALPNGNGNFYVVNGVLAPEVELQSGDATLLRMVHAGDGSHLCLQIDDEGEGEDGERLCKVTLLARDGVFHQTPYLELETVVLLQGTRADVAVQCTLPSGVSERTFNVRASADPAVNPASVNTFEQETVMQLVVRRKRLPFFGVPVPTSEVPFPAYLQSLLEADVQVGGETGVETILFDRSGETGYSVNGVSWEGWGHEGAGRYVEEFCVEKAYEMTLGALSSGHNADGPVLGSVPYHPYHQHINHFQVAEGHDNTGAVLRRGEWRDVVPAWGTVMRFRPVAYTGDVVVHCHLLQHEDNGMMTLMKLSNCSSDEGTVLLRSTSEGVGAAGVSQEAGGSGSDTRSSDSSVMMWAAVAAGLIAGVVGVVATVLRAGKKDIEPLPASDDEEVGTEADAVPTEGEKTTLL